MIIGSLTKIVCHRRRQFMFLQKSRNIHIINIIIFLVSQFLQNLFLNSLRFVMFRYFKCEHVFKQRISVIWVGQILINLMFVGTDRENLQEPTSGQSGSNLNPDPLEDSTAGLFTRPQPKMLMFIPENNIQVHLEELYRVKPLNSPIAII